MTDLKASFALQTIEIVEEEVERLLDEDSKADQSTYGASGLRDVSAGPLKADLS